MDSEAVIPPISDNKPSNDRILDDQDAIKQLERSIEILESQNLKWRLGMKQMYKTYIEFRGENYFLFSKCKEYKVQMKEQSIIYSEQGNLLKQLQEENMRLKELVSYLEGQMCQKDLLKETALELSVADLLTGFHNVADENAVNRSQEVSCLYGPYWEAAEETGHSMMNMTPQDHVIGKWHRIVDVPVGNLQMKELEEQDSLYERCRIAVEREEGIQIPETQQVYLATRPLACKWVQRDNEDRPRKCGKESRTIAEFASHFEDEHLETAKRKGLVCLWKGCKRSLQGPCSTAYTLTRHVHSHFCKGPFRCPHKGCSLTFPCWSAALKHQSTHTKSHVLYNVLAKNGIAQ